MSEISLKKIYSGKVRDLYEIDDKRMLMVASDRLSAFDVILDDPIPGKGEILTQISNFWFKKLAHIMCAVIWQAAVGKIIKRQALSAVFNYLKVCRKRNNCLK